MEFNFSVRITLEKTGGKFATRDELAEQITEELDSSIGTLQLEGENGGQYEVTDYEITNASS